MKIGLLTTSFPRFEGDVSGAFVLGFARALASRGHDVCVLAPEPSSRDSAPTWPGVSVGWVPYARPRRLQRTFYRAGAPENLRSKRPARWLGAATFTIALHHAARRKLGDCDALVSHWSVPSGVVASEVAGGRAHLCILHATDVRWLSQLPGRTVLANRLLDGASALWFLTPELRDTFAKAARKNLCSQRVCVQPMGVDRPASRPPLKKHPTWPWRLLFIGRLVPVKGVDRMLEALARLPTPARAHIAGDGPERGRLARLARQLGVDARFEGWVSGHRKEALLRDCDALIAPSHGNDGVPTVLFEAMARGLPVITTSSISIAHYLEHEHHALLVTDGDIGELAGAILRLQSDLGLWARLSREGKRASERFLWSEMGPTIESLLKV